MKFLSNRREEPSASSKMLTSMNTWCESEERLEIIQDVVWRSDSNFTPLIFTTCYPMLGCNSWRLAQRTSSWVDRTPNSEEEAEERGGIGVEPKPNIEGDDVVWCYITEDFWVKSESRATKASTGGLEPSPEEIKYNCSRRGSWFSNTVSAANNFCSNVDSTQRERWRRCSCKFTVERQHGL